MKTRILLIIIILLTGIKCKISKGLLKVKLLETKEPITILCNDSLYSRLQIPIRIKVENNSHQSKFITIIKYKYAYGSRGLTSPFYLEQGNKKIEMSFSEKKEIKPYANKIFTLKSQHLIDKSKSEQEVFFMFNEMKGIGKDIIIDNNSSIWKKRKGLFLKIIKGDSIKVNVIKNKKSETITIPVEVQ